MTQTVFNFKNLILIIIYLLCVHLTIYGQYIPEPMNNNIYHFLSKTSQKDLIIYHDNIKPLSRNYLAKKLLELKENRHRLTQIEKEQLEFYLKEFYWETQSEANNKIITRTEFLKKSGQSRSQVFLYSDFLLSRLSKRNGGCNVRMNISNYLKNFIV